MKAVKPVHREPREAKDLERVLAAYSRAAERSPGAALFCVMGGKMSEGINFSDGMARLVMVAGLPFPDITDEELKTKMLNLDVSKAKGGGGVSGQEVSASPFLREERFVGSFNSNVPSASSQYYFNLCMRSVNQTIGRAIRHAADYACIWLCDDRYGKDERVWNALPAWIRKGSGGREWRGFGEVENGLKDFLRGREL